MTNPGIKMCPSCHTANDVTSIYKNGEWVYTCDNHGAEPFAWAVKAEVKAQKTNQPSPDTPEGMMFELGVRDALQTCIHKDDPWLEYGVVEDRLRREDPSLYATLVEMFSHSARTAVRGGPETTKSPTTVSTVLAGELRRMAKAGLISQSPERGQATGYWRFDGTVAYWAPSPPPASGDALTWESYATQLGLDPDDWKRPGEEALWS